MTVVVAGGGLRAAAANARGPVCQGLDPQGPRNPRPRPARPDHAACAGGRRRACVYLTLMHSALGICVGEAIWCARALWSINLQVFALLPGLYREPRMST